MDKVSEIPPLSLPESLHNINHPSIWLPRLADRFSVPDILANFRSNITNPRYAWSIFALAAIPSTISNPLGVDPYPLLRGLILGEPKAQIISSGLPPELVYQKLVKTSPEKWINTSKPIITTDPVIEVEDPQKNISPEVKAFAENPVRAANTLRWKSMLERIVADKRLAIPLTERPYWVDHMLKIIAIESGGIPQSSSGIAHGLTALKPATADEMAREYQIKDYDIYQNAWDNTFLGTAYQLKLAKRYGPKIGVWAHHQGPGNIDQALKTYLISVLHLPISDVDKIFHAPNNNKLISEYITKYKITPEVLLASEAVTAKLKQIGAWGDKTWEYPQRFMAVGLAMNLTS